MLSGCHRLAANPPSVCHLTRLTYLDLSGTGVTNVYLAEMLPQLVNLRNLNLSRLHTVNAATGAALLSRAATLRCLRLAWCTNVGSALLGSLCGLQALQVILACAERGVMNARRTIFSLNCVIVAH